MIVCTVPEWVWSCTWCWYTAMKAHSEKEPVSLCHQSGPPAFQRETPWTQGLCHFLFPLRHPHHWWQRRYIVIFKSHYVLENRPQWICLSWFLFQLISFFLNGFFFPFANKLTQQPATICLSLPVVVICCVLWLLLSNATVKYKRFSASITEEHMDYNGFLHGGSFNYIHLVWYTLSSV